MGHNPDRWKTLISRLQWLIAASSCERRPWMMAITPPADTDFRVIQVTAGVLAPHIP
jgi:hypothetical protein